ncbi:MAG TPA: M17 family metallopeptidase [Steroidobacteraceae bacterium]|nr:M17 family metallopeptidase [Steroidobacteraceae bacterium]
MELLPAQRNVRIRQREAAPNSASLETHDAVLILCPSDAGSKSLTELPHSALWKKLYAAAAAQGPVAHISARVAESGTPTVIAFIKPNASAFERLSATAAAYKDFGTLPEKSRILIAAIRFGKDEAADILEAALSSVLAGSAPMPEMKSKPTRKPGVSEITLLHSGVAVDVEAACALDRGNHVARWLTTLPPNILDAPTYRRAVRDLAKREGWKFTFYDEAALDRLGAGAFLAVSRANEHRGAGIACIRYRPRARAKSQARLALVGKGICFDTGGINLKPHKSMYHMHEDMQGSAVALGMLLALSALEVPYEIDCWLAITENEINARAYRPQEVVRALNGTTIQVAHSDAEGRMVLADTLALAAREQPDLIVDYATLTGSCILALTERYSGAFTNRPQLHPQLLAAGARSGERVWPFPMDEDFDSDLSSKIADVLQCTPDSKGDHILAARFLNRFVPDTIPWIHLDLSSSNRSGGLAHIPSDFTGFGLRFTYELLQQPDVFQGRASKRGSLKRSR